MTVKVLTNNKNKNIPFDYNVSQPPPPPDHDAIINSSTTGNYRIINSPIANITSTHNGVLAAILDGKILQASHRCNLGLANLPPKARIGHSFQEFKNPLVSIALFLCDSGCEVILTKPRSPSS
jgi:hypothetical protein